MFKIIQTSPVRQTIESNLTQSEADKLWAEYSWKYVDSFEHNFTIEEMQPDLPYRSDR